MLQVVPKCSIFNTEQDRTGIKVVKCLFKEFHGNIPDVPQSVPLIRRFMSGIFRCQMEMPRKIKKNETFKTQNVKVSDITETNQD